MNIIITSTIFPQTGMSILDSRTRLKQTVATIKSLRTLGYQQIFLVDNSGRRWDKSVEPQLQPARIFVYDQYQFGNKGISETYTLLNFLNDYKHLLNDEPIVKLSGRYLLERRLDDTIINFELAGKITRVGKNTFGDIELFSTRCYVVSNSAFFIRFLENVVTEIYSYSNRIVGLGSLRRFIKNQLKIESSEWYTDPQLAVEAAFIKLINKKRINVHRLEEIGLTGQAGSFDGLTIKE